MHSVIVDRDLGVEMRDGVELSTDVYRPAEDGAYPTLLQRTPYDKSDAQVVSGLMFNALEAVRRGYVVVVQDVRGRYASEGEWEPMRNEIDDGYDTVEWAAEQPWCDGSVGTYGSSYMGVTAWHATLGDPPHLEAALPYVTGGNYHNGYTYTGGAFELGFNLWWVIYLLGFDTADRLDEETAREAKRALAGLTMNIEDAARRLPIVDMPGFDEAAPYWREWLEHSEYDDYWREVDVAANADRIDVPVLHVTGWYDTFLRGHLDVYRAIDERAGEIASEQQRLVVGPWYHDQYMSEAPTKVGDEEFGVKAPSGSFFIEDLAFEWFDQWLKGGSDSSLPPVRYFAIGDDEWREADAWPPEHTSTAYYLHSGGGANGRSGDGRLTRERPGDEIPDDYEYDPADPVPSCGGRSTMPNLGHSGIKDRSTLEERADVLVYTSPRLTSSLAIAGPVDVTLYAASSAPDTDFAATLVDVRPGGYCAPVAEGIVRARYRDSMAEASFMEPGAVYEFEIDLSSTAYTFGVGHHIRLEVSSSNFPRFDRNLNTDQPNAEATMEDAQIAIQQVFHDTERPSQVTLPVVE